MIAEAAAPASPTQLALLRDRITARLHGLSEIELRFVIQELGMADDSEPVVLKYEGGKYKLSTDPPEIAPYRPLAPGGLVETLREAHLRSVQPGGSIPAAEALARLRKLVA